MHSDAQPSEDSIKHFNSQQENVSLWQDVNHIALISDLDSGGISVCFKNKMDPEHYFEGHLERVLVWFIDKTVLQHASKQDMIWMCCKYSSWSPDILN